MIKLDSDYLRQRDAENVNEFDDMTEVSEDMVLYYTDCKKLTEVQVISLRSRSLKLGFKTLAKCPNLQIAFL